jgi:hypothetical protein
VRESGDGLAPVLVGPPDDGDMRDAGAFGDHGPSC